MEDLQRTERMLTVPAPAVMELWLGALLARGSSKEKSKVAELLQSLEIAAFDEAAAKEAAEIEAECMRSGKIMGVEDLMIAAITTVTGEKLVTRDTDFSRIPGLRLLKY